MERGEFASVSAVVAAGTQRLRDEQAKREVMLEAIAEEIRRRAEAPDEEFVEHAPGDFAKILGRVLAARLRRETEGCTQTPSEVLIREDRETGHRII